jgi:type IV secretion system protein VirB6
MDVCAAVPASAGFIGSVTDLIDCQSRLLGSGAWTALAAPGSTLAVVLTGFLTIFIALIGYNLVLGHSMSARTGTLALIKVGLVFALTTSWPAYRTLVYDLVTDGPVRLVAEIGPQAGVVGSDGTLTQRLDLVDQRMERLAVLGAGAPPPEIAAQIPPPPFGGFEAFALGGSRIVFELTAVGALGSVRIVSGLMLALGPFFIAFLLFDRTRSLFEGWIRVLAAATLATVGVTVALGLELALIDPWLTNVLARRMAGEALPEIPAELLVLACLFAMLVTAALCGAARIAHAFRLAPYLRAQPVNGETRNSSPLRSDAMRSRETIESERSRAAAVAGVLALTNRREPIDFGAASSSTSSHRRIAMVAMTDRAAIAPPIGRSFTRRPQARVSSLAARRDRGA